MAYVIGEFVTATVDCGGDAQTNTPAFRAGAYLCSERVSCVEDGYLFYLTK